MTLKIVSGGQTGVDRAALDVALDSDVSCGGWCPSGRNAEDGRIPMRYPLRPTPSADYAERTRWNVRDSDGTLVLTWGPPSDGSALTVGLTHAQDKPCFVADLDTSVQPADVAAWIEHEGIETLNVAGPRASRGPRVYDDSAYFLKELLVTLKSRG